MTTPPPLPERPLVEAYGVRDEHGNATGYWCENRPDAEWRRETHYPAGTVVPLIAADRLTSTELVADLADRLWETCWEDVSQRDYCTCAENLMTHLAALRTHLERP